MYLNEHADNPVDWYEWGDDAFKKAKMENKPLLISIGYSACHWCHVMEEESFMDTAVARVMNENFICIKVDREERPDVDNIYTNTLELLTGSSVGRYMHLHFLMERLFLREPITPKKAG